LIIGAITASAPKSSALLDISNRPTGMRTHACLPDRWIGTIPRSTLSS
jgi:hypothetical protein